MLQQIALGLPTYSKYAANNCLYVDKTAKLADLVEYGTRLFYARPRRFGKTLLLSVLKELFSHGDGAFRGKDIYGHWPIKERYPVVLLSISTVECSKGSKEFEADLCHHLCSAFVQAGFKEAEQYEDISEIGLLYPHLLQLLNDGKFVLLIDGYGHQLTSNIDNSDKCRELEMVLDKFWAQIFLFSRFVKFLFITGMARCAYSSRMSEFGVLDISMEPDFADLTGFTDDDLQRFMAPYLAAAADKLHISEEHLRAQLRHWYGGFCFDKAAMVRQYSPWAINNFLKALNYDLAPSFSSYWFDAVAMCEPMMQLLRRNQMPLPGKIEAQGVRLADSEISEISSGFLSVLIQLGFLSIDEVCPSNWFHIYNCRFPNFDNRRGFEFCFLQYALNRTKPDIYVQLLGQDLCSSLEDGNLDKFSSLCQEALAGICEHLKAQQHADLHNEIICLLLNLSHQEAICRHKYNADGTSVLEIRCAGRTYLMDFNHLHDISSLAERDFCLAKPA